MQTFNRAWLDTCGTEGHEAWWANMEMRYLTRPGKGFLEEVNRYVERWTQWKQMIAVEDDAEKSEEQREEEEKRRQEGLKKLEERMEIERKLAEEQKKKENKERWAKEKLERKAAHAKSREPWNGLSPAQQQAIIDHNRNIKNQKKKFRKHMAKAYKKDGNNPFKVPKPTFKDTK